jgi:uracil phosphoribosyltransferase
MMQGVLDLMPGITVGKMLIQRNENSIDKHAVMYYSKLPDDIASKERVFILDPMLATGGSVSMCIDKLKEHGVDEDRITFINMISCESGIAILHKRYPKVKIVTAAIDPVLNEHRYICPGLGDFGDRYFGSRLP